MQQLPRVFVRTTLVVLLAALPFLGGAETPVSAATSTSFSPASVALPLVGSSVTITVATAGIAANTIGVQVGIVHASSFAVTSAACTGLFAGATATSPAPQPYGTLLACLFSPGGTVSGTAGNILTFVLTRTAPSPATATIGFQALDTVFVRLDGTSEGPGTTTALQVVAPTVAPPLTPTATAVATLAPALPSRLPRRLRPHGL
ncbi:MAG TPA: hypothetical protein VFB73_00870 [Chloroflexota bacterium]|nr:hypothetical protein [Chloroflexota bacterium]HZU04502.1 hypothetical protein [Chloroflexota bacterium]